MATPMVWLVATTMATPLLRIHYTNQPKITITFKSYSFAQKSIYSNKAVKYSYKAFRLDGTSDSAVTH